MNLINWLIKIINSLKSFNIWVILSNLLNWVLLLCFAFTFYLLRFQKWRLFWVLNFTILLLLLLWRIYLLKLGTSFWLKKTILFLYMLLFLLLIFFSIILIELGICFWLKKLILRKYLCDKKLSDLLFNLMIFIDLLLYFLLLICIFIF